MATKKKKRAPYRRPKGFSTRAQRDKQLQEALLNALKQQVDDENINRRILLELEAIHAFIATGVRNLVDNALKRATKKVSKRRKGRAIK